MDRDELRKWLGVLLVLYHPRVWWLLAVPPLLLAGFIGAMHRSGWRL